MLLALVWLQFASAAHQFEHDAHEVGETCVVCLTIETGDKPLAGISQPCVGPATAQLNVAEGGDYSPTEYFSHYRARASP